MYEKEKRKNDLMVEYELAPLGKRLLAYIVDAIILSIFTAFLVGLSRSGSSFALSTFGTFLYYWYFWTQRDGQTPGKALMHIKVIKTTGAPLTAADVLARYIGYVISGMFFCLGFLWAAFDRENQGWHDKIAGTYVVEVEPERKRKYVTV